MSNSQLQPTRRGRKPATVPRHRITVYLPEDLLSQLDALCLSGLEARMKKMKSIHMERALREYLANHPKEELQHV